MVRASKLFIRHVEFAAESAGSTRAQISIQFPVLKELFRWSSTAVHIMSQIGEFERSSQFLLFDVPSAFQNICFINLHLFTFMGVRKKLKGLHRSWPAASSHAPEISCSLSFFFFFFFFFFCVLPRGFSSKRLCPQSKGGVVKVVT